MYAMAHNLVNLKMSGDTHFHVYDVVQEENVDPFVNDGRGKNEHTHARAAKKWQICPLLLVLCSKLISRTSTYCYNVTCPQSRLACMLDNFTDKLAIPHKAPHLLGQRSFLAVILICSRR